MLLLLFFVLFCSVCLLTCVWESSKFTLIFQISPTCVQIPFKENMDRLSSFNIIISNCNREGFWLQVYSKKWCSDGISLSSLMLMTEVWSPYTIMKKYLHGNKWNFNKIVWSELRKILTIDAFWQSVDAILVGVSV